MFNASRMLLPVLTRMYNTSSYCVDVEIDTENEIMYAANAYVPPKSPTSPVNHIDIFNISNENIFVNGSWFTLRDEELVEINVSSTFNFSYYFGDYEYWDDWLDWRDGMRGYDDHTKLRSKNNFHSEYFEIPKWNNKIKKHISIRNAKKSGKLVSVIY